MEAARDLDAIIFDNTGTLTEGEHGVVGVATADSVPEEEALALAAAVEGDSEHVIARAIREAAADRAVDVPDAAGFEAMKGRGVRARVSGEEISVGGPNLLTAIDAAVPPDLQRFADEAGANRQTVVYVVRAGDPIAAFAMADVVRKESYRVVDGSTSSVSRWRC